MTAEEFAAAHGNDSGTWTPADFEVATNLAEIDAHCTGPLSAQPDPA